MYIYEYLLAVGGDGKPKAGMTRLYLYRRESGLLTAILEWQPSEICLIS